MVLAKFIIVPGAVHPTLPIKPGSENCGATPVGFAMTVCVASPPSPSFEGGFPPDRGVSGISVISSTPSDPPASDPTSLEPLEPPLLDPPLLDPVFGKMSGWEPGLTGI